MASHKHLVVRSVFDVQVRSSQGSDLLDRIRTLWDEVSVPSLEAAFDAAVGDEPMRLDRLEVDLGTIPVEELSTSLTERLQQATVEALERVLREREFAGEMPPWQQALPSPVREALRRLPPTLPHEQARRLETLAHLLVTGRRAWWESDVDDLDREVDRLLDEAPGACVELLRFVPHALAGRRLAHQLSPETRARLVRHLGPEALADVAEVWTDALAVLHPERDPARLRDVAWDAVFTVLLEASEATEALHTQIHEHVARAAAALVDVPEEAWKTRAVRRVATALPASVPAEDWADADRDASDGGPAPDRRPDGKDADSTSRRDEGDPGPDSSPEPNRSPELHPDAAPAPPRSFGDGLPGAPSSPEASDRGLQPWDSDARSDEEGARRGDTRPPGPDVTYVDDAGLVILAPFLPPFFETLGLVQDGSFVDLDAHGRAVLLARHLATGAEDVPEPNLVLAALLCGWPETEPLPRRITLTDAEAEEASILLDSVVEHWAVLKNTSADGLRRTFLLREGKLEREPRQWHLTVDRRGVDVLLESLPWGLSVLSLPWMPTPLFVSW